MVDRSLSANYASLSPLRNTFSEDYESGMEASASSMASGGDEDDELDDEEEQKHKEELRKLFQERHQFKKSLMNYRKTSSTIAEKYHHRMSSGNSSTDSNAPTTASADFRVPLPIITHATSRIVNAIRREDMPTPSSGYDGDTEGPVSNEVKVNIRP
ncbi:hypothetical protein BD408DRAFT_411256 [Parasitella parasitica]|nr:hypothetical protein BD408DRAFT_411256 [Parasitella parasitica]